MGPQPACTSGCLKGKLQKLNFNRLDDDHSRRAKLRTYPKTIPSLALFEFARIALELA
jgi:hypothetical protein